MSALRQSQRGERDRGGDGIAEWLDAGAAAVGLGSDVVPAVPEAGDLDGIAARARIVAEQVARVRSR